MRSGGRFAIGCREGMVGESVRESLGVGGKVEEGVGACSLDWACPRDRACPMDKIGVEVAVVKEVEVSVTKGGMRVGIREGFTVSAPETGVAVGVDPMVNRIGVPVRRW